MKHNRSKIDIFHVTLYAHTRLVADSVVINLFGVRISEPWIRFEQVFGQDISTTLPELAAPTRTLKLADKDEVLETHVFRENWKHRNSRCLS